MVCYFYSPNDKNPDCVFAGMTEENDFILDSDGTATYESYTTYARYPQRNFRIFATIFGSTFEIRNSCARVDVGGNSMRVFATEDGQTLAVFAVDLMLMIFAASTDARRDITRMILDIFIMRYR